VLDLGDRLGERDKLLRLVASQRLALGALHAVIGRSSLMRARAAQAQRLSM
jgi:hypothetical protein